MAKITVTNEGYERLKEELSFRRDVKREEIKLALKEARAQGDLSENAEYDTAKTEQGKNEVRIAELEELVKTAEIVSAPSTTENVRLGSRVRVHEDSGDVTYVIVGPTEINISEGKISDTSPVGKALVGRKKGDIVTVTLPKRTKTLKILEISK